MLSDLFKSIAFLKHRKERSRKIAAVIIGLFISFSVDAQDRIIMVNGDTLNVNVLKINPETVEFTFEDEVLLNTENKNAISKIIFSSGREQTFNAQKKTQLPQINGKEDWKKVIVTDRESDVEGLTKVAEIKKSSNVGGVMFSLADYNDAVKMIKKEAASQGASIVLITDKPKTQVAITVTGVAYK